MRRLAVAAVVLTAAALAWRAFVTPPLCRVWDPFCLPDTLEIVGNTLAGHDNDRLRV